jgi:hypothetical protein
VNPADAPPGRYRGGNLLLDSLPPPDRARVVDRLEVFRAEVPDCIVASGSRFEHVIFPIDCVFSVTAELHRGNVYEVAAIGRQGVVGAELALGVAAAPRPIMSQIGGCAARMRRDVFDVCVASSAALERAVQRSFVRRLFLAEQFVACNFAHSVMERCARWILMLMDEVGRMEFELRDEFLGMMLGLQPPAAARAAADLQLHEAVRYANERLAVIDRDVLTELTCECYEAQLRFAPPVAV